MDRDFRARLLIFQFIVFIHFCNNLSIYQQQEEIYMKGNTKRVFVHSTFRLLKSLKEHESSAAAAWKKKRIELRCAVRFFVPAL